MTSGQVALLWAGQVAMLGILAGLLARGRVRVCWSFALYIAAVEVTDACLLIDPDRFWRASFYIWKEAILGLLKLALAAELAWRIFRMFPGAAARARPIVAILLTITTLAMIRVPTGFSSYDLVIGYQPHIASGVMWLFAATTFLAAWYRLPMHALHRAVLGGMTVYLGVFVLLLGPQSRVLYLSLSAHEWLGIANATAYLAMLIAFGVAAWTPATSAVRSASPVLLARLGLDPA